MNLNYVITTTGDPRAQQLLEKQQQINEAMEMIERSKLLLDSLRRKLEQEKEEIALQKVQLQKIIENNKVILKSNQVYLYNIKESSITMIADYKSASKIISEALCDEDNVERAEDLHDMLLALQLKQSNMEDNFVHNFKVTPDQYVKSKGSVGNTNFSIN